jgi:catechol 2,3-dioxygenase-like lactoylglutathione lyase family enzyme
MLEQVCPILPSRDLDATAAFYGKIGFQEAFRQTGQYLIVNRDAVELHFFHHPSHRPETCDHGAYLRPGDVDTLSAQVAALDLPRTEGFPRFAPAEDKPWGMREAVIWDPDGNLLRVGQET